LARDLVAGLRRERLLVAGLAGAFTAMLIVGLTDYTIRSAAAFAVLFGAIPSQGRRPLHR
jgi:hypothetical protein